MVTNYKSVMKKIIEKEFPATKVLFLGKRLNTKIIFSNVVDHTNRPQGFVYSQQKDSSLWIELKHKKACHSLSAGKELAHYQEIPNISYNVLFQIQEIPSFYFAKKALQHFLA